MFGIAQAGAPEIAAAERLMVVIAILVVAFWKVLLRLLIALIAIVFVVLVGTGVAVVMHI